MNKTQIITVFASLILFLGLYFGFDTKPGKQKTIEQSRSLQAESTSLESLMETAFGKISPGQKKQVDDLESQLRAASTDAERVPLLKKLSGLWYGFGQIPVAGGIAEQVAELENADSSWSVAGGTFFNGLMSITDDPTARQYCADHAVKAFESAASLAPQKVEHRVNLALVYAENPPPDNPMKAVLMLRELETKNPDNPAVYNALGRLAIKTGQWERAIQRLERARVLEPNNPNTPCLLAKAYEGAGNMAKASEFSALCKGK